MPTRSIKVKLVVPRNQSERHIREDIWTTHQVINQAVRYYEKMLLIMRGQHYAIAEGQEVSQDVVQQQLDNLIQEARRRNKQSKSWTKIDNDKAKGLLRDLYTAIVPSCIGEKGSAQNANGFIGPLTDRESLGYLSVFDKIRVPPDWLDRARDGASDALSAAEQWLKSEDGKERLSPSGAPPKWVKLAKDQKDWIPAFIEDYDRKLKEAEGVPTIVRSLKSMGVLPLFPAYLAPQIQKSQGKLSRWDRLSFRLATAHLLSWESCCILTVEEHDKRMSRLEQFTQSQLSESNIEPGLAALRNY